MQNLLFCCDFHGQDFFLEHQADVMQRQNCRLRRQHRAHFGAVVEVAARKLLGARCVVGLLQSYGY